MVIWSSMLKKVREYIVTKINYASFLCIDGIPIFRVPRNVHALTADECLMSENYHEGDGKSCTSNGLY